MLLYREKHLCVNPELKSLPCSVTLVKLLPSVNFLFGKREINLGDLKTSSNTGFFIFNTRSKSVRKAKLECVMATQMSESLQLKQIFGILICLSENLEILLETSEERDITIRTQCASLEISRPEESLDEFSMAS